MVDNIDDTLLNIVSKYSGELHVLNSAHITKKNPFISIEPSLPS